MLQPDSPPDEAIRAALAIARGRLQMEVAFVSQFTGGQRVFRYVDADIDDCPIEPDAGDPREASFCQRVVDGLLPEMMPDAQRVEAARELPVTAALPVGAHASVPIRLKDGRIYGTFCCFSRQGREFMDEGDLELMRTLADFVAEQIQLEEPRSARAIGRRSANPEDRRAFIQSVAHEFRTPLTVIQGTTEILRGGRTTDPRIAADLLDGLARASERLADLVQSVVETADTLELDTAAAASTLANVACREVVETLDRDRRVALGPVPDTEVGVEPRRFALILRSALEHALLQAAPKSPIVLGAARRDQELEIIVRYRSSGVEVLSDANAPQHASGAGVRLLLARALAEQVGSQVQFILDRPDDARIVLAFPAR